MAVQQRNLRLDVLGVFVWEVVRRSKEDDRRDGSDPQDGFGDVARLRRRPSKTNRFPRRVIAMAKRMAKMQIAEQIRSTFFIMEPRSVRVGRRATLHCAMMVEGGPECNLGPVPEAIRLVPLVAEVIFFDHTCHLIHGLRVSAGDIFEFLRKVLFCYERERVCS